MRIPKLLVLVAVYGMCAVGFVLLWNERRKNEMVTDIAGKVADDARVPAFK